LEKQILDNSGRKQLWTRGIDENALEDEYSYRDTLFFHQPGREANALPEGGCFD